MKPEESFDEMGITVDPSDFAEEIDVQGIEQVAKEESFAMCKNLRDIYFDEEFMKKNPKFKERLDIELESLRVLIKMRKSDEIVHDLCLKSVGMNPNNGSLYKALSGIQKSMLNIQIQMDSTVKNINSLLKNVQLEFDFNQQKQENPTENEAAVANDPSITRGSKRFIEQMNAELALEKEPEQQKLFEDEEE
jgi:hypothetical protein